MSQPDAWLQRWQRGRIGFHQNTVHTCLDLHWKNLGLPPTARVFVPLCGKTRDIAWFVDGERRVVALDVSPVAIENLLQEIGLPARRRPYDTHTRFECGTLSAICGDFFRLSAFELGQFQGIYDRAAFGAIEPEMRSQYVASTLLACGADTLILLVVLDYAEHETAGPPFSISSAEVARHYGGAFSIEELGRTDLTQQDVRMRARGVTRLEEVVYKLTRWR